MKPYWAVFGTGVKVRKLLDEDDKGWHGMPAPGGSTLVCWNRQTGVCSMGSSCPGFASHDRRLVDSDAAKVAETLKDGIAKVVAAGALPPSASFVGGKRRAGR